MREDLLSTKSALESPEGRFAFYSLDRLGAASGAPIERLPRTARILLENLLRRAGDASVTPDDVLALARWPGPMQGASIAFMPTRVLMQDFTGVPAVVDLAALRSAAARAGKDPTTINPSVPVDLVVDHSVQVDRFGTAKAYETNLEMEYRRNRERYSLLNWAQHAFDRFRVVPPGMGICHQVNLEYLSHPVTHTAGVAFPETLVGTDSHTTMINGLGVLGWGVGGIEAEAAMLGRPMFLPQPRVLGIKVTGWLPPGTTATDLVLTLTEILRGLGVVGKFVEFFGDGLSALSVADRATIANMSPEFGATSSLFPVDDNTLEYLKLTGRHGSADLTERYMKEQGLFRLPGEVELSFDDTLELDLTGIGPSLAGPKRPQDRVRLADVPRSFAKALGGWAPQPPPGEVGRLVTEGGHPSPDELPPGGQVPHEVQHDHPQAHPEKLRHGSVVIAAITSCTNTSNPSVMVAAGLLARNAVEAGLQTQPWVKTSLAPGSRVVTAYLDNAGLLPYLDKLGFNLVGYGCTTCIGNSGPLPEQVAEEVERRDLAVVAVLSGNRNFEGRIHPQVRAAYLASPPLSVAYALAGRVDIDLTSEALGTGKHGPVYLKDLWPDSTEVESVMAASISAGQFEREYGSIFEGDEKWRAMPAPQGSLFKWDSTSTYVKEPPYFENVDKALEPPGDIVNARVLVLLGDSITTDHISPAGSIKVGSPAGRYLRENGVGPEDFNSFGARRGNHEVMLRGTFGNVRLKNKLVPDKEGPWTLRLPDGEQMPIYEAAVAYARDGIPLIAIAGKDYGSGSSRDWAAKGPALLGVRAVIAESFERIHRSNLVGMGVLPLEFGPGDSAESLGLTGRETFTITGLDYLAPGSMLTITAQSDGGDAVEFEVKARIDVPPELDYYRSGGILNMVLRNALDQGLSQDVT